ncbi:MAG: sigma-54 dependent transcriptional regulator, acetoin dehydrogenase operon transcriptional [Frankiales bacterium]|nr:sigma-54 dependent transcriptional regulator, acetoin dehydrogenase operon transcriptional [Frankiales bacterium]
MPETNRPDAYDERAAAQARDRFLTEDAETDPHVRRMIFASWKRSRESKVDIDRLLVPYLHDPDLESPLSRAAAPILDNLRYQLEGEPVSVVLTDHTGFVIDRRTSSSAIANRLDAVCLAPGFSYAEEFVGTNGIGTTLSSGRSALVDGREHYTDELGEFACAGAPIRHPTRRTVIGILDLTSWSNSPGGMLMALASATAKQIEDELLGQTGLREFALFQEYLKACQQSAGPVLALNNDVVMMNEHLREVMDTPDQAALISYAVDTMRGEHRQAVRTVELPSGRTAHLRYSPASSESGPAGGVFRIRLGQQATAHVGGGTLLPVRRTAPHLPGLVGSGPAWTRCVQQVNACYESREWVALEGEPGVGKLSLLRAVHRMHKPAKHLRVIEPPTFDGDDGWLAALAEELAEPDAVIVLAHADRLSSEQVAAVADLLTVGVNETEPSGRPWVAMTRGSDAPETQLRGLFSRTVEVLPLRHHIDDIPDLVRHLILELLGDDRLVASPQALAQLSRLNWPGNVSQLRKVLGHVVKRHHAGTIELADLPPECRSASRRVLSPIEALERDAIVLALDDNGQNPTAAAQTLGMSRATIYRKIRQYGIVSPPQG